jgi:hypothetical protein
MGMIFGLCCPKLDAPTYGYVDERMTTKRWICGDLKTGTTTNDTYHLSIVKILGVSFRETNARDDRRWFGWFGWFGLLFPIYGYS